MKKEFIIQIISGIIACVLGICTSILGVLCLIERIEIGCVMVSLFISIFACTISIALTIHNLKRKNS